MTLFDRVYAAGYDVVMGLADRAGLDDVRDELVGDLDGDVLEVGAGTGLNLARYRAARSVVALEPDPGMRRRAQAAAAAARVPVEVVAASAEALPYPDERFDHVVSCLVLCTVPDPARVLREARRVLRPGGRLHLYEHVRATDDPALAAWQDRLRAPWSFVARGCQCNRDTPASLVRAGFDVDLEHRDQRGVAPIMRPHVLGRAVPVPFDELLRR